MSIFFYMTILGIGFLSISLLSGYDHDFSHDGFSADNESPGFFSMRIISVFMATAGCTGILAEWFGLSQLLAGAIACISGLFFANIVREIIIKLISYQSQGNMDNNYDGLTGIVSLQIPQEGPGEIVVITKNNQKTWLTAYSENKNILEVGTKIKIVSTLGSTANVEKL